MRKKFLLALAIAAATTTGAFAQANDTFAKVKAANKVVMGTRESSQPLAYTTGGGQFTGYHVELCQNILKSLFPGVPVEYVAVTSANRIPLVQNGTVDIECGSTTNNTARQKDVSFLNTTYVEEVKVAVKANSGINSIAQLNGKTIATTTGTTSVQHLRKHERAQGMDFKEVFGKDHADSFLLLESGRADAFAMDGSILAGNIATSRNPGDFKLLNEVLNVEPIAIMIRKDDASLKKLGNDVVAGLVKSGEMNKLWDKWFLQPIPPKNIKVGLALRESTKQAWATPNDKPMEDYAKK